MCTVTLLLYPEILGETLISLSTKYLRRSRRTKIPPYSTVIQDLNNRKVYYQNTIHTSIIWEIKEFVVFRYKNLRFP
jgi:hypothetical protein